LTLASPGTLRLGARSVHVAEPLEVLDAGAERFLAKIERAVRAAVEDELRRGGAL
jgi:hypothetical protein